jgi:flagellar motor switch protein FliN/FliY
MSEAVAYEQLDQDPEAPGSPQRAAETSVNGVPPGAEPHNGADLRRLSDVLMELSVEIGRTRMTVGEMLQLRAGSIVTLERLAGEPVDLLVNGTAIARGEVVIVDEQFGLRVTEIVEGDPAGDLDELAGGDAINAASTSPAPSQADPTQADPAMQE